MVNFDTPQTMLNANPFPGKSGILRLLFGCQRPASWLLLRLKSLHLLGFVALKPRVFPQFAARRKTQVLFLRQFLVVFLAFTGGTENLDLAGPFVTDDIIFDGMAFLFAAVVALLPLLILGATDRAF